MWYLLAAAAIVCIGVILWFRSCSRKCCKPSNNHVQKPSFKTEQDLEEYGKPMKDEETSSVDMDDA